MGTNLQSARVIAKLLATLVSSPSPSGFTPTAPLAYDLEVPFSDGSGANEVHQVFAATRTISSGGESDTLQVTTSGALLDPFGNTINLAAIKAMLIVNNGMGTDDLHVGAAGSDPITSLFGGTGPYAIIKPGGAILWVAPAAAGYGVTASTADQLKIADGGTAGGTYDIIMLGD